MVHFTKATLVSTFASLANAHAVILAAQGPAGPPSVGFHVEASIARNCTGINPCQLDASLIRDAEIAANVVNECGRTELNGNIDVGESTENALSAKAVTQAKPGDKVTVTIHQVNSDGAGPYVCDMDMTGNTLGVSGQTPLEVENNVPGVNGFSQAKTQNFNITVTMPDNMNCTGASTGNVCTVRCRNNALAGPFGGCFPVQQVENSNVNSAKTIKTAVSVADVEELKLIATGDLPSAIEANKNAGLDGAVEDLAVISSLIATFPSTQFPQETPNPGGLVDSSATTTADAAQATDNNKNNGNKNNGNKNNNNNNNNNNNGNKNNANGNKNANGNNNAAAAAAAKAAAAKAATEKAAEERAGKNGRRDGQLRWARRSSTTEKL
ncbi:hypothetical protein TD95_004063 [Thielaviopsis punctulata]|uniref:Gas1-like protein n=1 Tax=Thielaviopsis punctulata TaxID=72032 RepID=A0A0F4ZGR6_9PEZI|nr:hypothetical protein TD95_004063 [Thielaviopsis punctulata]